MKIAIYTLGCKVNQYESDLLIQKMKEKGYEIVDFDSFSDIYLINSCSVTNMSDRKSRQMAGHAKRLNKDSIVVLTGCYAQAVKEKIQEYSNIDIAIGNLEKDKTLDIIEKCIIEKEKKHIEISDVNLEKVYKQKGSRSTALDIRESVKIEDGCNNFCSYCIIPYVRGRVRSRKIEDIVKEVEALAKDSVKEVVLVGIEIASYGLDIGKGVNLVDCIEEVAKIPGIERIRLGSLEPTWVTKENVERMKKIDKLCPHFHLSMQSGSTTVLKRMNRKYTAKEFMDVVNLLKENFLDVALTTDIIVGFPGETDEEFIETVDFVKEVGFKEIHVFKYSIRNGTRAAKMENQISGEVKNARSKVLIELSKELEAKYLERFKGKKVSFLIENIDGGYVTGYTDRYIKIKQKRVYENWEKIGQTRIVEIK
ncbi:MAG: tRNA (N(6)-L-threonylcarbamoyladenosine(37)-C(2))-methylthiotransferase MtaB [Clostridia bacterium]